MFYNRNKREILKLAKQIKPVVKAKLPGQNFSKGGLFYILPVDVYEKGFRRNEEPLCKAEGLYKLAKIDTLHVAVNGNQFRPSIEEVLQQIPEEYLRDAVAFSIASKQELEIRGMDAEDCYVKAQTTLYGAEKKERPFYVEKQYVIMGEHVVQWDEEIKEM